MIIKFIKFKILFFFIFLFFSNTANSESVKTTYFAGGCFWCMEESFEKIEGVLDVVSGYSGGTTKNPTYKEVTYGKSGHFEVIKIEYNSNIVSYQELLNIFWINIDPFDEIGQFCDKGYSYRSVVFYSTEIEKKIIQRSIKRLEKKFIKKIVTYVKEFDKFYKAEDHHQDYYKENFINYLIYKNRCGRVRMLEKIWN